MPRVRRDDTKGLYQDTGKGAIGVECVQTAVLVASSAATEYTIAADAGVVQPAKSQLVGVDCIVTTACAATSGNFGLRIGTSAGDATVMVLDADSLDASVATLAVGLGTSTDTVLTTALEGTAALVAAPGEGYTATERKLYPEVVASGGTITAGKLHVFLKFVQFA